MFFFLIAFFTNSFFFKKNQLSLPLNSESAQRALFIVFVFVSRLKILIVFVWRSLCKTVMYFFTVKFQLLKLCFDRPNDSMRV